MNKLFFLAQDEKQKPFADLLNMLDTYHMDGYYKDENTSFKDGFRHARFDNYEFAYHDD